MGIFAHKEQIQSHHEHWNRKPELRRVYRGFYRLIASHLSNLPSRRIVELGSGIGSIKDVIPDCLTTDMFMTPWNDQVENAYHLSFQSGTVSDLIMVDVFHHLEYPGTALAEFHRVLQSGGKVLIFEPFTSVLGLVVYGLLHSEGLRIHHKIQWLAPPGAELDFPAYYTSQGNATRVFSGRAHQEELEQWSRREVVRLSAFDYLATGGYTRPQLAPGRTMPFLHLSGRLFEFLPAVFATRMLVVLTA